MRTASGGMRSSSPPSTPPRSAAAAAIPARKVGLPDFGATITPPAQTRVKTPPTDIIPKAATKSVVQQQLQKQAKVQQPAPKAAAVEMDFDDDSSIEFMASDADADSSDASLLPTPLKPKHDPPAAAKAKFAVPASKKSPDLSENLTNLTLSFGSSPSRENSAIVEHRALPEKKATLRPSESSVTSRKNSNTQSAVNAERSISSAVQKSAAQAPPQQVKSFQEQSSHSCSSTQPPPAHQPTPQIAKQPQPAAQMAQQQPLVTQTPKVDLPPADVMHSKTPASASDAPRPQLAQRSSSNAASLPQTTPASVTNYRQFHSDAAEAFVDDVLPLGSSTSRQPQPPASRRMRDTAPPVSPTAAHHTGEYYTYASASTARRETPLRSGAGFGSALFLQDDYGRRHDAPASEDPLEKLLIRAQQRLREKERTSAQETGVRYSPKRSADRPPLIGNIGADDSYSAQDTSADGFRHPGMGFQRRASPDQPRSGSTRPGAFTPRHGRPLHDLSYQPASSGVSASLNRALIRMPSPIARRDDAQEHRLHLENTRLTEEVAYLAQENEKLRSSTAQISVAELTKLKVQVDSLRDELEEREAAALHKQRQLEDSVCVQKQHNTELEEQMKLYAASIAQYEQLLQEKEAEKLDLQVTVERVASEGKERQAAMLRHRDEVEHQRNAEREKVERTLSLFEDAKRQRTHLMELNDKLQREKDQAINDRRKAREELVALQNEVQRLTDRYDAEMESVRRDSDRSKEAAAEKERTLTAQLREERRANAVLQERIGTSEQRNNDEVHELRAALRAAQDDFKKRMQIEREERAHAEEKLHQCEMELTRLSSALESFNPEAKREMESVVRDAVQSLHSVRQERDDALLRIQQEQEYRLQLEEQLDVVRQELSRAVDMSRTWQQAKDKADAQNVKLSATLQRMVAQDEHQASEIARLRDCIEDLERNLTASAEQVSASNGLQDHVQALSTENDRLTRECGRLARERDDLVEENGALANEMLTWRNEMRSMVSQSSRGERP